MKLPEPSKSQLLAWKNDKVTCWVIEKLHSRFKPLPSSILHESLNRVNHVAGQQSVIEALDKLHDYIPQNIPSSDR